VAYTETRQGVPRVWVVPFTRPDATTGGRWLVSSSGDFPSWRADGRELFYVSYPDRTLTAVQVNSEGDAFEVGPAEGLFPVTVPVPERRGGPYAVSRDGERVLVLLGAEDAAVGDAGRQPVHIEFDWPARVPR
jgi:hypothetical protein